MPKSPDGSRHTSKVSCVNAKGEPDGLDRSTTFRINYCPRPLYEANGDSPIEEEIEFSDERRHSPKISSHGRFLRLWCGFYNPQYPQRAEGRHLQRMPPVLYRQAEIRRHSGPN